MGLYDVFNTAELIAILCLRSKFILLFYADAELFQLLFPIADSYFLIKMGTRSRQENCGKSN
jgi:hypothetical protein